MSRLLLLQMALLVAASAACGRYGFDVRESSTNDGGAVDAEVLDGAPPSDGPMASCPQTPSVQTGEVTLSTAVTVVALLNAAPSCSVVFCERRTQDVAPNARAICELTETTPTTLRVTSGSLSLSTVVRWQVISSSQFSVQRGVVELTALEVEGVVPVAIDQLSESVALATSYSLNDDTDGDEQSLLAATLSATTLVLRRGEAGSVARAAWQVVSLPGADVQRQRVTMGAGQLELEVGFATFPLERSAVLTSIEAHRDTDGEDAAYAVRSMIEGPDGVRLVRRFGEDPVTVSIQLVALPASTAVVTRATLATTAPHDSLSLVGTDDLDPTRTVVFSTSSIDSGSARDALPAVARTTEIDSGVVRVRRAAALADELEVETTAITFSP